jgi:hypothetical protein
VLLDFPGMTNRKLHMATLFGAGLLVATGGAGCYHHTHAQPMTSQEQASMGDALVAAQNGETFTRQIGEYSLRTLGGGGVEIWRTGIAYKPTVPVGGLTEANLTTKIKSVYAADPNVSTFDIHVDSHPDGTVTLRGAVPSSGAAETAIKDALNVSGVNAVDSYLTFNR